MFHHVFSVTKIIWVDILGRREENSVAAVDVLVSVGVYVYVSSGVRNRVVTSDIYMRSGQDGCECCWVCIGRESIRWPDSGKRGVIGNYVLIRVDCGCE